MICSLGPDLFLQAGGLEGEQELLDVVFPQLVNAASVNGSTKKFIHLVLRVHGLLNTTAVKTGEDADQAGNTGKSRFLRANIKDQYSRVFTGGLIDPLKKKTTTDKYKVSQSVEKPVAWLCECE